MRREDLFTVCWSSFKPTPPITPTSCCRRRRSWSTRISIWRTDITICSSRGRHWLLRAKTRSNVEVFRALASAWVSTTRASSDSEDDMIRALLDSGHPFIKGITLERLDREHSVRLNIRAGRAYLPFAQGGFGTPSGKCEFGAEAMDYSPRWNRASATRSCAKPIRSK